MAVEVAEAITDENGLFDAPRHGGLLGGDYTRG